jgi:predicted PurR-regulated permease PerM
MIVERQLRFWLIGLVVFLAAVYVLRGVLLPFVAGMAVAYLLDPVCDRLEAWGLSRTLATTVLTILFLIVSVAAILLLVPVLAGQVASLLERVPDYVETLRGQFARILAVIETRVDPAMLERLKGAAAGSGDNLVAWLTGALGGYRLVAKIDEWLPRQHAEAIREQAREVDRTLAGFLRGQGMVCAILGIFYALALSLAGLDFGLIIGLIAGLLSFIPYVGAIVGLLLSVGLALVQFDDWTRVAIIAAIFFAGQAVEGNFLTPKLVGERVGLHPVWVIFGLLAGGTLFGFVGVLLAVPVAAVVGVGMRFGLGRYMASPYYQGDTHGDGGGGREPGG